MWRSLPSRPGGGITTFEADPVAKSKPTKSEEEQPVKVRQPTAITVRGSKPWRAWVSRGAKFCRTDTTKLIDSALVAYLRSQGFTEDPPER